MQFNTLNASQISNIETLNGNYVVSGNTFNLTMETERIRKEIISAIDTLSGDIVKSGSLSPEQVRQMKIAETELKTEVSAGGTILDKFQSYGKLLKSFTGQME